MAKGLEKVDGVDLGLEVEQAAISLEGIEDEVEAVGCRGRGRGDSRSPVIVLGSVHGR